MDQIATVLKLAELFGAAREIGQARVSTLVFNDGKRLKSLASGADMGSRSAQRAIQWFSDHWPVEAVWPDGVERPVASTAAA